MVEYRGEASLGQVHQVLDQVQVPQKRFIVNKLDNVETHPKLSILKIGKNLMCFSPLKVSVHRTKNRAVSFTSENTFSVESFTEYVQDLLYKSLSAVGFRIFVHLFDCRRWI
jgi:hypothetical protein